VVGHVVLTGKCRGAYRNLVNKPEETDHLQDLGIYERIILKWMETWNGLF
jgi:hypothetical protein